MATIQKPQKWPRIISAGSVKTRVYRIDGQTTANGLAYVATWTTPAGRKTKKFAKEADAIAEARLQAEKIAAGRSDAADMTRGDFEELAAGRSIAGSIPMLAALREWKQARELTAGNLIAAAEAWAARQGIGHEQITLAKAAELFLKAKRSARVKTKQSYDRVFPELLKRFGEREISSLSSRELQHWFEERYPHPVTRNTVRKRCVSLWRWCRKKNYLPRDVQTEAERIDTAQEPHVEIGIISVDTFGKLLHYFRATHPEYLAALALAGFAGLRRAELHAQTWEDIDLSAGHLRVTTAKTNTPAKRLVSLSPSAVEWLMLTKERKGVVCFNQAIHRVNLAVDRIRDIAHGARNEKGEPLFPRLPENCFRHAFISHRVAATGNVAETSLEAGNSPRIIFQHYRALVTKAEGEAWFAIPTAKAKPGKVYDIQGKAMND